MTSILEDHLGSSNTFLMVILYSLDESLLNTDQRFMLLSEKEVFVQIIEKKIHMLTMLFYSLFGICLSEFDKNEQNHFCLISYTTYLGYLGGHPFYRHKMKRILIGTSREPWILTSTSNPTEGEYVSEYVAR